MPQNRTPGASNSSGPTSVTVDAKIKGGGQESWVQGNKLRGQERNKIRKEAG